MSVGQNCKCTCSGMPQTAQAALREWRSAATAPLNWTLDSRNTAEAHTGRGEPTC